MEGSFASDRSFHCACLGTVTLRPDERVRLSRDGREYNVGKLIEKAKEFLLFAATLTVGVPCRCHDDGRRSARKKWGDPWISPIATEK